MEECINIKNTLIACSNKYWLKFNVSFGKGLVFVIGIKEEPLICLLSFHVYLKLKEILSVILETVYSSHHQMKYLHVCV